MSLAILVVVLELVLVLVILLAVSPGQRERSFPLVPATSSQGSNTTGSSASPCARIRPMMAVWV
jgi:hypothetical protein